MCDLSLCAVGDDHKLSVHDVVVEPFCNVWELRDDCGCDLVRVFLLYVRFDVSDGCGMWVFL